MCCRRWLDQNHRRSLYVSCNMQIDATSNFRIDYSIIHSTAIGAYITMIIRLILFLEINAAKSASSSTMIARSHQPTRPTWSWVTTPKVSLCCRNGVLHHAWCSRSCTHHSIRNSLFTWSLLRILARQLAGTTQSFISLVGDCPSIWRLPRKVMPWDASWTIKVSCTMLINLTKSLTCGIIRNKP